MPIWARVTEFCSDTTLTGKVVPRPSANTDITASRPHSGSVVNAMAKPLTAASDVPAMATRL